MIIIRNVAGMKLEIELTAEEIKETIAQHATITLKPSSDTTEPKMEPKIVALDPRKPEPVRNWKPVRTSRIGVLPQFEKEVLEMYQQGMSCPKIATVFHVAEPTVRNFLKRRNVHMRTAQEAQQLRWQEQTTA